MIKKASTLFLTLIVFGVSLTASAANLIQIYNQALTSDPTFKKAHADWLVASENFPLALTGNGSAGSGLFPNLNVTAGISSNYQRNVQDANAASGSYIANSYQLQLTQPLFNIATWKSIAAARFSVKSATANYLAAAQTLMSNVINAYFEVLRANDTLSLTLAQKEQDLHQLITAEQKFKVGLIAITGVYDAQASYDRDIANEIKNRNILQNRLEDLRAITGVHYSRLNGLRKQIPLLVPQPRNISRWVQIADRQNYTIQADLNTMLQQQELVKEAAANGLPSLNAVGSYGATVGGTPAGVVGRVTSTKNQLASVGLQLNFPVFDGGYDITNTKQQRYTYLSASQQLEIDHRNVVNQTRQAYLGVESGISQIKADQQAIVSARNQLAATRAGYVVGTRTMVDVLDAVTKLTQAQQDYADDRYDYVLSIVNLKLQAGTLSPEDIVRINKWLGSSIKFDLKQPTINTRKKEYKTNYSTTPLSTHGESSKKTHKQKTEKAKSPLEPAETTPAAVESHTKNPLDKSTNQQPFTLPAPKTEPSVTPPPSPKPKAAKPKAKSSAPQARRPQVLPKSSKPKSTVPQEKHEMALPMPESRTKPKAQQPSLRKQPAQKTKQVAVYSIQFYATHDEKIAKAFIAKQSPQIRNQLHMVKFQWGKLVWYRILYGMYPSSQAAEAALKKIPKVYKAIPWVIKVPESFVQSLKKKLRAD